MSDKIQVGRPLPDLPVVNLEGQPTTVPAHLGPRGGFVSLVHGTWCSDCVIEFYRLRRYHRDFMSRGVAIVAIAHDAPESLALFRASAVPAIDYTLLADPKRLYSPSVREEARTVLAAADAAPSGPRLAQTRAQLDAALRRAATPIAVRLTSDAATEVTVYRVGSLGRFQAREIELTPGTYTVVGSRSGYKDVRIELVVDPDSPAPGVFVACREPV